MTPPAVEALAPPMNISMFIPIQVPESIAPVSIVFKPVDLVIEEVNMLETIFWNGSIAPRVAGLLHSATAIPTAPMISSSKLAHKTIREFSDHCLGML